MAMGNPMWTEDSMEKSSIFHCHVWCRNPHRWFPLASPGDSIAAQPGHQDAPCAKGLNLVKYHVCSAAGPVLAACDKAVDVHKLSRTRRPPTAGSFHQCGCGYGLHRKHDIHRQFGLIRDIQTQHWKMRVPVSAILTHTVLYPSRNALRTLQL